jgi:uncharacterized protein YdhG (YjbR/CyaY superfamily)
MLYFMPLRRGRAAGCGRRAPGGGGALDSLSVSAADVDAYLNGLEAPKRETLETLRRTILEIIPQAQQVISYSIPAFTVEGRRVAGFAAFKAHLSYVPFSGSVLAELTDELAGYTMTKSALHFAVDRPLPKVLVERLIEVRLDEARRRGR